MLREIVERNRDEISDFIVSLLDFKVKPDEYEDKVKELEKKHPNWWKSIPNQGGANYSNSTSYRTAYERNKRKGN